ncbi:MAG: sulfotransferase family protein [Armatimonadota bacterium]
MLPNALHIGAAKCASSWLWRVYAEHPEIYVPQTPDNVNFFTVHYQRGLDWYQETYFSEYAGEPVAAEFSNSYMCYPPALERIAQHLPDVRMTMILRHPAERAFLQWAHTHLKGRYGFDPENGIGVPFEKVLHHHGHAFFRLWIDPSCYARHLENIYELFERRKVRVLIYEDLVADEALFLRGIYEFLGVDTSFESSLIGRDVNPDADAEGPRDMLDAEVWDELIEVFRPDVEKLQELLDRDLSAWLR